MHEREWQIHIFNDGERTRSWDGLICVFKAAPSPHGGASLVTVRVLVAPVEPHKVPLTGISCLDHGQDLQHLSLSAKPITQAHNIPQGQAESQICLKQQRK